MQHIAKNVVTVNEGKTKFLVSLQTENNTLPLRGRFIYFDLFSSSAGCEEQILQQEAARDQPHPSAQVGHRTEHGSCCAQRVLRQKVGISGLFHLHFILRIPVEKLVFNKMIFNFFESKLWFVQHLIMGGGVVGLTFTLTLS